MVFIAALQRRASMLAGTLTWQAIAVRHRKFLRLPKATEAYVVANVVLLGQNLPVICE